MESLYPQAIMRDFTTAIKPINFASVLSLPLPFAVLISSASNLKSWATSTFKVAFLSLLLDHGREYKQQGN